MLLDWGQTAVVGATGRCGSAGIAGGIGHSCPQDSRHRSPTHWPNAGTSLHRLVVIVLVGGG